MIKLELSEDPRVLAVMGEALGRLSRVLGGEELEPRPCACAAAPVAILTTEPPAAEAAATLAPPPAAEPPAAPPAAPATGVELDTEGIPWDARIHTEARTKVQAGTWKLKRGIDDALVVAVKAELKSAQAIPAPSTDAGAAAPSTDTAPPPPAAAPAPPAPAVPPAPAAQGAPQNFAEFLKAVTGHISSGKLTADQVNAACQTVGLATCNLLAGRPDLIPQVWEAVCHTLG